VALKRSVGHFHLDNPSRTFPPNPNHKPNPNSNSHPNTNATNPGPTDRTLTITPLHKL